MTGRILGAAQANAWAAPNTRCHPDGRRDLPMFLLSLNFVFVFPDIVNEFLVWFFKQ